jgi:hypothetical protein
MSQTATDVFGREWRERDGLDRARFFGWLSSELLGAVVVSAVIGPVATAREVAS